MRYLLPMMILMLALPAGAQQHDPAMHQAHMAAGIPSGQATDARQWVTFPEAMKAHTLANMRDHLLALQEIQAALGSSDFDRAAELAETRLGMTALAAHGAHESSAFMPNEMQEAGSTMHRSASRFATTVRDVAVTGELKPALNALAEITGACVSCHAGYRLQ